MLFEAAADVRFGSLADKTACLVVFPESYVVEIDGKIESVYRIYIEALKAGMELKQKFPHSHIKVHDEVER